MKLRLNSLVWSLCAAFVVTASSGCCCFWQNVHNALNCGHGGHGCGGSCETACAPPTGGCGQDCGHGCGGGCGESYGGGGCGESCGGCCQQGCGGGFTLFGWLFGHHGCVGGNGCNILGCGSHYLDPQGACYGAYCGNCCESGCGGCCQQSGCGDMYWGDFWNVPPTTEPCDCCQNYIGPYWPQGSTPSYYGPAGYPQGPHGGGYAQGAHPAAASGPVHHEGVVVAEKPATSSAPAKTSVATKPAAPAKPTTTTKTTGTPAKTVSRQ